MAPPPLGAPDGSMLPDWSVDNELAARMDNLGVVPEAGAAPRAKSGRPSRMHPRQRTNRELLNLESASADPHPCDDTSDLEFRDSGTTSAPSTRKPSTSRPLGSAPEPSRSSSGCSGSAPGPSRSTPRFSGSAPGPSAKGDAKDSSSSSSTKGRLKTIGLVAGVAVVAGAAAVAAAPVALAAAGFTSSGVAAGSMAAAYQATLGGVIAKGSVFAALQSFGAAGLPAMAQATTAVVGAGVGGSAAAACKKLFGGNETGGGDGGDVDGGEGEAGTESEATNGADEERRHIKDEKDVCTETYTKSTDRKPSKKAEEQEPSRQNMKNEEAARKRDSFRK